MSRVHYESFLANPKDLPKNLASIPPSTEFEFESERDAILDPTSRQLQTQALAPIDAGRIEHWRSVLKPEEIGIIEFECRELMTAFRYQLDGGTDGRTSTRRLVASARSDIGELITGSLRRFLRVAKARIRDR